MRQQSHLALTAGICGIPMWGCDVGGFSGDPGPELFARWMQMSAFLPIYRAHGYMRDREPWSYVVGVGLAVAGAIGSIYAFNVLAPDILSPTAIRWTSVIVFGGAGLAALTGAVLLFVRRDRE